MSKLPLLPADRYIAQLLGLSDEQYRWYMAEVERRAREAPQPAVVAGPDVFAIISLVSTILSIGLTIAASFFKPKQGQARLLQNQTQGLTMVDGSRFTPRSGFDSLQDIATLGDPIPLIYANREQIGGGFYGGVRVNTPLIWSQMRAIDKSQFLRAMFLIGEGAPGFQIDVQNTAIGNNTLGAYLLGTEEHSRFSLYFRPNGGRITSTDLIGGTSNDPGAINSGDVYGTGEGPNFCHTRRPSTQTQFGVYSLIGNGLGYRINPQFRPGVNAQITVKSKSGKKGGSAVGVVVCEPDFVAQAQRQKYNASFSGRSGLINTSTYLLSNTSDAETKFTQVKEDTEPGEWSPSITVLDNPFSFIDEGTLISWISLPTVVATGNSVTATVLTNVDAVIATLGGPTNTNPNTDGTYLTTYNIAFTRDNRTVSENYRFTVIKTPAFTVTEITLELDPAFQAQTGGALTGSSSSLNLSTNSDGLVTGGSISTSGSSGQFVTSGSVTVDSDLQGGELERIGSNYGFSGNQAVLTLATQEREEIHEELSGDAAAGVAGRQKSWDDALQIGELFKIGSALAICTGRNPRDRSFTSDADNSPVGGGTSMEAYFQTIRGGVINTISPEELVRNAGPFTDTGNRPPCHTATNFPHLFRIAIANFSTTRQCYSVRIVIKSTLGIRINGLCNFKDSITYQQMDNRACLSKEGTELSQGDYLTVDIFNSGLMSSSEERYSFFRIRYREAGFTNAPYTTLNSCYGIRGITQQSIFNDIRFIMPGTTRWEFQIEPLTGWEIRSGTATGNLYIIDSTIDTQQNVSENGITARFQGRLVFRNPQTFRLASTERLGLPEIGLGFVDEQSYVDAWGKLAESFIYDEVRSSAENGPEHEIVAIDELAVNTTTPFYNDLAILGFNARSGTEWQQFGQMSVYVTKGLGGGTHLFPEVLFDLLTNERYGKGDQITADLIDTASFQAASAWCSQQRYFFDGAITGRINLRQWAADTAAAHLLIFGESGGKFFLRPALTDTNIRGIFTAGNILEGTFQMEFFEPEDRRPIQISVKYREERLNTTLNNPGLFPVEREILVREAGFSKDTDPIEQLDLSQFCTNRQHAIDAARFVCRMRRIPDHAIRFQTTHEGVISALAPGDFIRVVVDLTQYNLLRNGGVLQDGTLVTTQPFANGNYTVLAWDGTAGNLPTQTTLTVSNSGRTATPTGVIFTLVNSETRARTYQIERITPGEDGGFSIEAVHMPTNSSNILELAAGFTTGSNWVIQD